jgi:hypothetical protein
LLLIPGWYYLLSALKLEDIQRFAYDSTVIQFFSDNDAIDIKYALSHRAKDAIEFNVNAGDQKAKKIAAAFKWSFPAMGLLVFGLLLAMFNVYEATTINQNADGSNTTPQQSKIGDVTMRSETMTEPTQSSSSNPEQPQSSSTAPEQLQSKPQVEKPVLPNPNVQAPQNVLITEGYEPPKKTPPVKE